MTVSSPMSLAGAVWCDTHHRRECSARSQRSGGRCHSYAIRGLAQCKNHAGTAIEVAKAKGAALSAWSALGAATGQQADLVDPATAVMGMLHMSWLRTHLYAGLLYRQVGDDPGDAQEGSQGLVVGETIRGMVQLEAAERDRTVRFAKAAHDMGIAQREIELAESQTHRVAVAFDRALDALDLSPSQRETAARKLLEGLRTDQ